MIPALPGARDHRTTRRRAADRRRRAMVSSIVAAVLVLGYLAMIRPRLMPYGTTGLTELVVASLLALALIATTAAVLGTLAMTMIVAARRRTADPIEFWLRRLRRQTVLALMLLVVLTMTVLASQWLAYTPPIVGSDGRVLPGSIASLEPIELGGTTQWISVRGTDSRNPVLLYLAGGPGGSELAKLRVHLPALEEHFVVVNWDQPGAGKSYRAVPVAAITPERYMQDAHALVLQLRERFTQEQIYLFGDSWGSVLGIQLVQRYPELFHAYIGTGQMVAFLENDTLCYQAALDLATARGDERAIARLTRQGPPPYYGEDIVWKQAAYLQYLNDLMPGGGGDLIMDTLRAPEYGLADKVNFARGVIYTLSAVYPQLWELDFRKEASTLQVPIYIFHGRHEYNAMPALVEDYYQLLAAPHKELVWLEASGHFVAYTEPDTLVDLIVNRVLGQRRPAATHE